MERSGAARRYASAAFDIARESDSIDQWAADLQDIATVMLDPRLSLTLANNRLGREARYRIIERVLDISPLALNFAKLLVNKGRTLEAGHIADEFRRLADAHLGISNARIVTAVELTPEEVGLIQQRLEAATGKTVRVATQVDPSIIGGLVVRVDDELIDGSVRSRLHQLRRHLEGVA